MSVCPFSNRRVLYSTYVFGAMSNRTCDHNSVIHYIVVSWRIVFPKMGPKEEFGMWCVFFGYNLYLEVYDSSYCALFPISFRFQSEKDRKYLAPHLLVCCI